MGMRRVAVAVAALVALGVPLVAFAASRGADATPTFAHDVAPILRAKCEGCHRVGGIAPFAFATRKDVATRAGLIADAVRSRVLPPWPAGPLSPRYVGGGR